MRNGRIGVKQQIKQGEKYFSKMAEYNSCNQRQFANIQSSGDEYRFNCSVDESQVTESNNNNKTESFDNLINLLEDLKTTIMESTKSGKSNLRESTIVSMETVLNQIKNQLKESQMTAGAEGSEESSSSVVSMIREVENSIKSLKRPTESFKSSILPMEPPSVKVNSLEIPNPCSKFNQNIRNSTDATSPSPKDVQAIQSQRLSERASSVPSCLSGINIDFVENEIKNSESKYSKRSNGCHRSTDQPFRYSVSKKDSVKSKTSRQSSIGRTGIEEPKRISFQSIASSESGKFDQLGTSATDMIQRKCRPHSQPENQKTIIEPQSAPNTDAGRKISSVLSKVAHSIRRHSGRSSGSRMSSPNREPIELCSRILKFCAEAQGCSPGEVNQFQTCTPEELYQKISAIGPEGEEFLKNAERYLDQTYLNAANRDRTISSRNDIREEPDGRPSISKRCENRVSQSGSIHKMPSDENDFENDSIKLMLQDLRTSVKNIESKKEPTKTVLDPEVRSLLLDVRNSMHASNQMLHESDAGNGKTCVCNKDPVENLNPKSCEGIFANGVSPKSNLNPPVQSQMMTDIKSTLSDIRQSIKEIEYKDQSGPGPEVLNMLTDVRNTIKTISTSQKQAQPPQPEVLSALEELRGTIYSVEERAQQAQEKTNREMMNMLDSVRKSIRSVEASNDERAALKNQQILDTLNEMRQSVTNLEERSFASERSLDPKVTGLLGEIRSSIKFMESTRASQRSAADTSMMNVLQDIKKSLVSIGGKGKSVAPQRPSVNMFVLGGKPDHPEEIMNSPPKSSGMLKFQRTSDLSHDIGPYQEETTPSRANIDKQATPPLEENYVKKALDEIRQSIQQLATQKPPTCDGTELKQSINEFKQEIRSLLEGRSESSPRYSERQSLEKMSENVTDIKTGMKSLIDNIPIIVDAAKTDSTQSKPGRRTPSQTKNSTSKEDSSGQSDDEESFPVCKKVLDIMSERKDENAPSLPRYSKKSESSDQRSSLNSMGHLPSTFTLSFVGPQPPDSHESLVININGRSFKCSRI